eukprot:1458618-Heterocapsa_arctica.AAC.1
MPAAWIGASDVALKAGGGRVGFQPAVPARTTVSNEVFAHVCIPVAAYDQHRGRGLSCLKGQDSF